MSRVITAHLLRGAAILLILLLTVSGTGAQPVSPLSLNTQVDADTVILEISLHPDTSASWTLEYWVRLDDDNATAAFDSLQSDIQTNRSEFVERFAARMRRTARSAENTTGREMAIQNVSIRTDRREIPQRYGLVIYEFNWTSFATGGEDRLVAGDAIGGLLLTEETTLIIDWPEQYRIDRITPPADTEKNSSVVWRGPRNFEESEPRIALVTGQPVDAGGISPILILGGVVVLAVLVLGGWVYLTRSDEAPAPAKPTPDEPTEQSEEPPEQLLSNEERVLQVIEEHGGRMKQQDVAEELDWTDAKTSQVVGQLRDAGDLDGFRLGRENVLSLPDEENPGENSE